LLRKCFKGALDAAKAAAKVLPEVTYRKPFEDAAKSGGYNTNNLDSWIAMAERDGIEKSLAAFAKENPGIRFSGHKHLKRFRRGGC
jgi:hypothetical protein